MPSLKPASPGEQLGQQFPACWRVCGVPEPTVDACVGLCTWVRPGEFRHEFSVSVLISLSSGMPNHSASIQVRLQARTPRLQSGAAWGRIWGMCRPAPPLLHHSRVVPALGPCQPFCEVDKLRGWGGHKHECPQKPLGCPCVWQWAFPKHVSLWVLQAALLAWWVLHQVGLSVLCPSLAPGPLGRIRL